MFFLFRLAEQKHQTVDQLLFNLGPDELYFWIAYYQKMPFPDSWKQTADLGSYVFQAARMKVTAKELYPEPPKPATPGILKSIFNRLNAKKPK